MSDEAMSEISQQVAAASQQNEDDDLSPVTVPAPIFFDREPRTVGFAQARMRRQSGGLNEMLGRG